MGSGASAGVAAWASKASEGEIRSVLSKVSAGDRERLAGALAAAEGGGASAAAVPQKTPRTISEVFELFKELDSSGDSRLQFEEARGYLQQTLRRLGKGDLAPGRLRGIFDWLDQSRSGTLNISDLADFLLAMTASDLVLRVQKLFEFNCIRLLSAKWLLSQDETFCIKRRQDLPEEAFISAQSAASMFTTSSFGVIVLSYGWITAEHPDPEGFHLRRLRQYLLSYTAYCGEQVRDVGIFWDFPSLPQEPRTDKEDILFRMGLRGINILYGSTATVVLQLTEMPSVSNLVAYEKRGWCTFERVVSCILKDPRKVLNLGLAGEALDAGEGWMEVRDKAVAGRRCPLHPSDMAQVLESRNFTNNSDKTTVCHIYQEFFYSVCPGIERLNFEKVGSGDGWDADEIGRLSKCLKDFSACQVLRLCRHPMGDEGLIRLTEVLSETIALRTLDLEGCDFGDEGLASLSEALNGMTSLWLLRLPGHLEESPQGLKIEALAEDLRKVRLSKGPRIEWAE